MKKLLLVLMFLLYATQAHAGLISLKTLSEDASIGDLNQNFNIIEDESNGNWESANIKDDTLAEVDFADDINPRVRTDELFDDITISGMLPATSTAPALNSDISAGTSYVEGYRVVKAAEDTNYTASKDTWVFIDINGNYQLEAVTIDAAQPATPSNSLLLAKVVTDTDNITTVTDLRTTSLSIASPENFLLKGYYVLSSDPTSVSVDPGVVYVGTTRVVKTSITGLRTDTVADWWDGVADPAATAWWYIGVSSAGNIKWIGAKPPDIHDTDENTEGNLYYWDDGTLHWRVIGVVRMTSAGRIDHMVQAGNMYTHGSTISLSTTISPNLWRKVDCDAGIPTIGTSGIFSVYSGDNNSNGGGIWIKPQGTSIGGSGARTPSSASPGGLYTEAAGSTTAYIGGELICPTRVSDDTSQVIEYLNETGDSITDVSVKSFIVNIRD